MSSSPKKMVDRMVQRNSGVRQPPSASTRPDDRGVEGQRRPVAHTGATGKSSSSAAQRRLDNLSNHLGGYVEPAREIPVLDVCEVLVVGAGPAGLSAAVASARAGADTMLLERYGW
jgi:NADPH-dependent 2,4-dienoyl-CoA reductase/sulfur reductase-like enzyme